MCTISAINHVLFLMLFFSFLGTLCSMHDNSTHKAHFGCNSKFNEIFLIVSVITFLANIVLLIVYNFICLFL